jgi:hypothetical protein
MPIIFKRLLPAARKAIWPFSIALLFAFLLYATIFATSNPLCCADDASIAVVSKNLASGLGYLSTVNYWGSGSDYYGALFDPGISTGVTSVIPVAIAIYLFGPLAAIPGLVHIALSSMFLAAFLSKLRTASGKVAAGGILALFVILTAVTSAYHFEHWYAQLGEVPAAMLVILGAAVLAFSVPGYRAYLFAGLLMGCAVLTKHLAILYVVGSFLVILVELIFSSRPERVNRFRWALIFSIGVCVPIVFFESWKLVVLGIDGWVENWQRFSVFMLQAGVGGIEYDSLLHMLSDRLDTLQQRFFLPPYALILALVSYPFLLHSLPIHLRRFSILLLAGFVLHAVYWAGWSIGWARYVYIAVIVGTLLFSIAQVEGKGRVSRVLLGVAILTIFVSGFPKLLWQNPMDLRSDGHARSAQMMASYIELKHPREQVHTQWWAHTSALEYLSSVPRRYSNWNEPGNLMSSQRLVVTNYRFLDGDDTNFVVWLADSCGVEVSHGVYTLYSCR